jgi:DNA-binding transcriptional MerR regulator
LGPSHGPADHPRGGGDHRLVAPHAALRRARRAHRAPALRRGYRLYGPAELQRLRTLRELLDEQDLGLGEVGFALRLRREPALREAVDGWLDAEPSKPDEVPAGDWLRWEQDKHSRLLAAAATLQATR